jgi:hypothetical protein
MSRSVQRIIREYKDGLIDGTWSPEDSAAAIREVDDPDSLMDAFKEVVQDPRMAAAFKQMIARYE